MSENTLPLSPDGLSEPVDPLPGYVFEERLGRGGMGVVYRARQLALDRVVAVKMILDGAHADAEDRARFLREAKTLAQLQHPHIVQVHEVGEYQGRPYLAMEYVAGGNLEERLREQPLPPREAAELVRALAQAVQAAHDAGIVHRDLKPANVLIAEFSGQSASRNPPAAIPKITDFGLAKRLDDDSGQTRTGAIVGTPSYMAPEQATGQGKHVGPLADVYALGAILYECLTGRPPFRAAHVAETLLQVVQQEPVPPRQLNPSVPRDLDTLCLKCLEKTPERRCHSAAELAEELERFLAGQPVQARPVGRLERGWRWCRRNPVVASLVALLLLLLCAGSVVSAVVALTMRRLADNESAARQAALDTSEQLRAQLSRQYVANGELALDEEEYGLALLWFARALALDRGDALRESAHQLRLAATWRRMPRLVGFYPHDGPIHTATMSPDGRLVATAGYDRTARLWDVATGSQRSPTIRHEGFVYGVRFSPDGKLLATAGADAIVSVWDVETGQRRAGPFQHSQGVHALAFTPDGTKLVTGCGHPFAFWTPPPGVDGYGPRPYDKGKPVAAVWDLSTGACLPLAGLGGSIISLDVSNDGRRVAMISTTGFSRAGVFDLASGQLVAAPVEEPNAHRFLGIVINVRLSHDGKYLAVGSYDGRWRLWEVEARRLVAGPTAGHLFFNRDATRCVGRSLWELPSGKELRGPVDKLGTVLDVNWGVEGCRLLSHIGRDRARVWDGLSGERLSPPLLDNRMGAALSALVLRGRGVLVPAVVDHAARLWDLAGPSGTITVAHPAGRDAVRFDPSGQRLLSGGKDKRVRLWDTTSGQELGTGFDHGSAINAVAWSPDGKFAASGGNDGQVRLWDVERQQAAGPGLAHPQPVMKLFFAPDSARLFTLARLGIGSQTVHAWELRTRQRLWQKTFDGQSEMFPEVSPDGRYLGTADVLGSVFLLDAATGTPVATGLKHLYFALGPVFSPDGARMVSFGGDMHARLWEVPSGKPLQAILHTSTVQSAIFSPDGTLLATGDARGAIRIWDAASGQPVSPVLRRATAVIELAFSANGRYLLSAAEDGQGQLWDARSGERLGPPMPVGSNPAALLRADGRQVLLAGRDGATSLWDCTPFERSAEDWLLLAQVHTGRRIAAGGSLEPLTPTQLREDWEELRRRCPAEVVCAPAQVRAWQLREAERLRRLGRPRDAAELLGSPVSP